jgi:hypothetical protein
MRFMVIVKANKDSEAGKMPSKEMLMAMGSSMKNWQKQGYCLPRKSCRQAPRVRELNSRERNARSSTARLPRPRN